MATCAQPVANIQTKFRASLRASLLVVLAFGLPVLAGLAWHQASDNPIWPLVRNSLNLCELHDSPLAPLSPDGLYRAHVVHATYLERFSETLVFVTGAAESWPPPKLAANRAVLEAAGLRTLDAITWQDGSANGTSILQLWFAPGASTDQIHRTVPASGNVIIKLRTSEPIPGADHLD